MKSTFHGEVIVSIELDDKFFFNDIEVSGIYAGRMLPAELLVAPTSNAKQLFVSILTLTQVTIELFLVHRGAPNPHPVQCSGSSSPAPSPQGTEEKGDANSG